MYVVKYYLSYNYADSVDHNEKLSQEIVSYLFQIIAQ